MNAVFTICAKNYLAQALTLKASLLEHNPNVDFHLFLADEKTKEVEDLDIIELNGSWIPDWQTMAFKYNVIEFATSIKPFCFDKLFKEGYGKVIYLDPDIFVTSRLDYIFDGLEEKSMMITPHYNHIETNYTGAVTEEELLFVGIYNLGFGAIKNNEVGNKIINWWKNRLFDKCYADKEDALHVDQKWIDFLPGFFPNDIFICQHPGINIAIWNLHERELHIAEDGKYYIKDLITQKNSDLLFFHFSGFDPFDRKMINRRHPKYNIETYPSFEPIINRYADLVYKNNYDILSKLKYSYNIFLNGFTILPLHRRLFRIEIEKNGLIIENPFSDNSTFYKKLNSKNLILKKKNEDYNLGIKGEKRKSASKIDIFFNTSTKIFIKLFGIKYYYFIIKYLKFKTRLENQYFLIEKNK